MTGYKVEPEALRKTAKHLDKAEGRWDSVKDTLAKESLQLPADAAGLLGKGTSLIENYNASLGTARSRVRTGASRVQDASSELSKTASYYEDKDFEYYQRFGYTYR